MMLRELASGSGVLILVEHFFLAHAEVTFHG